MESSNSHYNEILNPKSMYCYPGTDVLENSFDCRDPELLKIIETRITILNLGKLHLRGISGNFDYNHYMSIHYDLFHQIYPKFAGKTRDENISKGSTPFCRPEFIGNYLAYILEEMRKKSRFISDEKSLIQFLAYYYGEINIIHPFREGNGRTEREFLRQFVLYLNRMISFGKYELDFSVVKEKERELLIQGSIDSACRGDYKKLELFFERVLRSLELKKEKTI